MTPFLIAAINHFGDITIEVFLFVAGIRWFAAPADRRRTEKLFLVSVIAFIAEGVNVNAIRLLSRWCPYKYDLYVYDLDARVFHTPGFMIGRFLDQHLWTKMFVTAVYNNVPAFMLITFIAYLYLRRETEAGDVFKAFIVNPVLALGIYVAFPVAGPAYAFGQQFPTSLPAVSSPHLLMLDAVPNGVPSVHISIALLVLWFLRPWLWGRVVGVSFLVTTIMATLGLGEHYVFDLLCAVPYTALVLYLTQSATSRIAAIEDVEAMASRSKVGQRVPVES